MKTGNKVFKFTPTPERALGNRECKVFDAHLVWGFIGVISLSLAVFFVHQVAGAFTPTP